MTNQLVSIIIPAYNCASTIGKTIEAVLHQTYSPIEVIVVDDGSKDNTAEIVKSFPKISYIFQNNAGPASARNRGAHVARGDLIFFTDSDCIPHLDWIEAGLKAFTSQEIAVVSGSYGIANAESLLARCVHAEILYRHHHLMPQSPKAFGSYNFGIKRKIFEEVGGFDDAYPSASGEDNDLSYKIVKAGYRIHFERGSLVDHFHPTETVKYMKEQFRHGYWRVKMYLDHPSMAKGDDYTFWKDIVEIPLGFLFLLSCALSFNVFFRFLSVISLMFLVFIQVFFSFKMQRKFFETIFYAFVMFLRSFSRMSGFSTGILHKLLKINEKKVK